ncbi:hypothetical protein RCH14_003363 [Massilia sp. MP_M2]|uniref:hypothetical protein n=1 Tax=Massilia sp. MP_M2 TaxID=3071713 RepID=UPI00319DA103
MPASVGKEAEVAVFDVKHPSKHLVREYLARRSRDRTPPPAPDEIRRQFGWAMLIPAALKGAPTAK